MRRRMFAFAPVLAVLAGAVVASVAAAAPPDRSSTLRPWGKGSAAQATATTATPKGATRLVLFGQEADFTSIDTAPEGDSPGDQILFTDTLLDQAGRRVGHDEARGQMHETFPPTGQFRFAVALYL
jgi:hypothetical protein